MKIQKSNGVFQVQGINRKDANLVMYKYLDVENKKNILEYLILSECLNYQFADFSKASLKGKLYELYGANLQCLFKQVESKVKIEYHLSFLQDCYLPSAISNECEQLFEQFITSCVVTDQLLKQVVNDLLLQIENINENKDNLSKQILLEAMINDDYFLKIADYKQILPTIQISDLDQKIQKLNNQKGVLIKINATADILEQYSSLPTVQRLPKDYNQNISFKTDNNLDQSYLAMAVVLNEATMEQLSVLNMLIGGDSSSLLFLNVREKHSLCYSIYSQIIDNKFILIRAGIDNEQMELALNEIELQINNLKTTDFTSHFELVQKKCQQSIKKMANNQFFALNLISNHLEANTVYDIEQKQAIYENIQYEEIKELAKSLKIDAVHILN